MMDQGTRFPTVSAEEDFLNRLTQQDDIRHQGGRQRKGRINGEIGEYEPNTKPVKQLSIIQARNPAWWDLSKKLWALAWPLSNMEVISFTKELIITAFVGHLGALELSALVLAQTIYNVSGNAPMLGMVAAMETFCSQAYGAKKYAMMGVVLQRAFLLVGITCLVCIGMWLQAEHILLAMGQDAAIARMAVRFTILLAPCLLMDGVEQCCRRYLSAQSIVMPLMVATLIATLLTPVFLWYFIWGLHWGLDGAAAAWILVQGTSMSLLLIYVLYQYGQQEPAKRTWQGWSWEMWSEWPQYIKVAIPSIVMICLDWWTFEVVVILSGLLPHPDVTMSMMGITFNLHALCFMAAHGLSGAASTRVGNELGANRPRLAWLTVQVAVLMGTVVMVVSSGLLVLGRHHIGVIFTSEKEVIMLTAQAVPALAFSLVGEGANTVMAGVLRGCGRQNLGATINLVSYWVVGLPCSMLLAFKMGLGAMGLWTGLACTASVQALLLAMCVFRFDWQLEATRAKALVGEHGFVDGDIDEDMGEDSETPIKALLPTSVPLLKGGWWSRGLGAASALDLDVYPGCDLNEIFGLL